MDTKNIAIEIIGIPILIIGILTIFTDWSLTKIAAISFACGFIAVIVSLLTSQHAESEQPDQSTDQQSATPTTRKIPTGIIATIIVIAIFAGIFFLIPGDTSDKIEKVKSVIPGYEKIPDIPVFADNFSDSKTKNNYRISGGKAKIENGKMIVEAKSATLTINRDFTDCDKITVKFSVKKIACDSSSAFGCFIEDGYGEYGYPTGYYDSVPQILLQEIQERNPSFSLFKNGGIWKDKKYQVTLKRTVKSEKVDLRFTVDSKSESNDYQIPPRKLVRIGFCFISENNAKFEIDDLKIYAYTT